MPRSPAPSWDDPAAPAGTRYNGGTAGPAPHAQHAELGTNDAVAPGCRVACHSRPPQKDRRRFQASIGGARLLCP